MTEAMPFLQKYDITFLRPPTIIPWDFCNMIGGTLMILSINAHNFHVISFSSLPQILR